MMRRRRQSRAISPSFLLLALPHGDISLHFDSGLKKGAKADLWLDFTGILNDKLAGFYRSMYEHAGQTKYLATSQFEPVGMPVRALCSVLRLNPPL